MVRTGSPDPVFIVTEDLEWTTALVAMIRPELFRFRRADVRVDTTKRKTRGRTVAKFSNNDGGASTRIATNVDEDSVRSVIMNALTRNN